MNNGQEHFQHQTTTEMVAEHRKALRELRKTYEGSPQKARALLVRMGILEKDGRRLARRYR